MSLSKQKHEKWMRLAYQLAQEAAAKGEIPVGAIVVSEGKIIGKGYNQTELLKDTTAHAEIIAMTAASQYLGSKYLKDCTLYVSLEPCPMCAGALAWSQISMIVFGAKDASRGYQKFQPSLLHPKTQVISGIMEKECSEILEDFFKKIR